MNPKPQTTEDLAQAVLNSLRALKDGPRPIFHLEPDFQHELANKLADAGLQRIRIGFPVVFDGSRKQLDIVADGVVVELKYKPGKASTNPLTVKVDDEGDEKFDFVRGLEMDKNDRAEFLMDVWRIEKRMRQDSSIKCGFAVLLTNRERAWTGPKNDEDVNPLHGEHTVHKIIKKGGKEESLSKKYDLHWKDWYNFSDVKKGGRFRFLVIQVNRES